MDNQNNDGIIQFGNNLNPNSNNNKKFNDLSKDNQTQNNNNQINNNQFQNIQNNINQNINNNQSNMNAQVNSQPNMNIQSNNMQSINNVQPQNNINEQPNNENDNKKVDNSNIVTINNQEVVNLDDYKEDNRFRAKVKEETPEEKQNKKNAISTVIIIIIILLIIFGIVVLANKFLFNSKVDNNNALTFVSNAESFITDAKTLVKRDEISTKDLNYAPSCIDETKKETIIYLSKILSNVNDNKISPFGGEYNLDKSYVKVKAIDKNNTCTYEYYLYLTDNNYSIGTENNPINSDKITKEVVKKNSK